jgi:dephospho-CoA kinase
LHGSQLASRIIILTGGIGCGKTAVAKEFEALGVCVVDADAISHALTRPGGEAMSAIAQAFGNNVLAQNGGLDRAAMREEVFRNPDSRKRLEAILHPLIREKAKAALAQAQGVYAIYVVPLWLEKYGPKGINQDLAGIQPQAVVVVDCPEALQIERVMARSNLSQSQVRAIMSTQVSRNERLSQADHVISNDGPQETLKEKVADLHKMLANSSHHNE